MIFTNNNQQDSTAIEWVDRETFRYICGGHSALVWVDYEPGFFSSGRIIKLSSLEHWEGTSEIITKDDKDFILKALEDYFQKQGEKYRIEN